MALTKVTPTLVSDQVFGRRNVVINGSMQVAQRGTQTGLGASSAAYGATDRFCLVTNGIAGRMTIEQSTDAPNGFGNSVKLSCTTTDTSLAAGDYLSFSTRLEGRNLQRFKKGTSDAEKFSVSFYVKANANATYVCELYDYDSFRHVNQTFSVTTSWTRVELTFPADTTGAMDNDSNLSLAINIYLHAGSNFTGGTLQSTWGTGYRATGTDNFFDSTDRTLFLTGVQLEVGDNATPFEHLSLAEELALCQRYFMSTAYPNNFQATHGVGGNEMATYNTDGYWIYQGISYYADGQAHDMYQLPVTMRATPTPTPYAPNSLVSGYTGGSTKLAAYGMTGGNEWRAADINLFSWASTPSCCAYRVDYGVSDEDGTEGLWIGGFEFDAEI